MSDNDASLSIANGRSPSSSPATPAQHPQPPSRAADPLADLERRVIRSLARRFGAPAVSLVLGVLGGWTGRGTTGDGDGNAPPIPAAEPEQPQLAAEPGLCPAPLTVDACELATTEARRALDYLAVIADACDVPEHERPRPRQLPTDRQKADR